MMVFVYQDDIACAMCPCPCWNGDMLLSGPDTLHPHPHPLTPTPTPLGLVGFHYFDSEVPSRWDTEVGKKACTALKQGRVGLIAV